MVKQIGKGALFYNDATPQRISADPLKPPRSRADTARGRISERGCGDWVSLILNSVQTTLGVTHSSASRSSRDRREGSRRDNGSPATVASNTTGPGNSRHRKCCRVHRVMIAGQSHESVLVEQSFGGTKELVIACSETFLLVLFTNHLS